VIGVGFAVRRGSGQEVVPVRSAILGVVMAVVAVVATATFGASLNSLVSTPSLYGRNWSYEMTAN
jgi:drug/metabolite transporter (DMT)-like permease